MSSAFIFTVTLELDDVPPDLWPVECEQAIYDGLAAYVDEKGAESYSISVEGKLA